MSSRFYTADLFANGLDVESEVHTQLKIIEHKCDSAEWSLGLPHTYYAAATSPVSPEEQSTKMTVKGEFSETTSGELDRVQSVFPSDNLYLYDKDPLSPRAKVLIRKRSTTASRLQRALSGKNKIVPTEKCGNATNGDTDGATTTTSALEETAQNVSPQSPRYFVMDTAVHLTSGVQSQERHLFLFSDVMVIGKIRASGNYKLKEKVRVAEMWLSNCVDVVCEVAKNGEASFVIGWPTTNVVATFSSTHVRDLWLAKLKQLIAQEQRAGPITTSIRLHYWDPNTKEEFAQNVSVSQKDTVSTCIASCLKQLDINVRVPRQRIPRCSTLHFTSDWQPSDSSSFQLWVKVDRDSAAYPLIGHESPFAIKMNCLYANLAAAGDESPDADAYYRTLNNSSCPVLKCYFILRNSRRGSFDVSPPKKGKRSKKSPILQKVFRRSLSKPESLDKSEDADGLFGQPLTGLVRGGGLPKPIMDIFTILNEKGPYTTGIFRKSANARTCRELRDKVNSVVDGDCDFSGVSILVLAALLKEFFRSLPDCLLVCGLYTEWLAFARLSSDALRVQEAHRLLEKFPPAHVLFLKYFLCVLCNIRDRSSENMMTANNLAVCVGPSLLWPRDGCSSPSFAEQSEASKLVPAVVEFLIVHCKAVVGDDCLSLLGPALGSGCDLGRRDSGNEESDSLHSLQSSQSSVGLRRDDSSIDSLEHALLGDGEHSPKLPNNKTKMSLSNLSRDSGLTMSDTQLYTADEEVDSEASSAGSANCNNVYRQDRARHNFECSGRINCEGRTGWRSLPVTGGGTNYHLVNDASTYDRSVSQSSPLRINRDASTLVEPIYGQSYRQQDAKVLMTAAATAVTSSSSRSIFPLGDRKDAIKRRLSRPRPWVRPVSSYGPEDSEISTPTLRRSNSEESILSTTYMPTASASAYSTYRRQLHVTQRTEAVSSRRLPPKCTYGTLPYHAGMMRSKSVHQFRDLGGDVQLEIYQERAGRPANVVGWQHSRSTPHIEKATELSYDSSTLSDNDSTPHMSRSNSRGKDYGAENYCGVSKRLEPSQLYEDVSFYHRSKDSVVYPKVETARPSPPQCSYEAAVAPPRRSYAAGNEIHHAAPARVEISDEELEPPPLPPKPHSFARMDLQYHKNPETEWYGAVPHHCSRSSAERQSPNTTVISGKRVLTATQSIYDVPSWNSTNSQCGQQRARTAAPSRGSCGHVRAKSQPPPQDRRRLLSPMESLYDCPSAALARGQSTTRRQTLLAKRVDDTVVRLGSTVGRTFKRELSWSVLQLRSLFSRHKSEPAAHTMWLPDEQKVPPPPYRAPPKVRKTLPAWTSARMNGHPKLSVAKSSSSAVDSQDSASGGEESYV